MKEKTTVSGCLETWNILSFKKVICLSWTLDIVHGRTTLWETVFSIFSGPENGFHLKASTYLENKQGSLCLDWLWASGGPMENKKSSLCLDWLSASGGLKFWVELVQEHASSNLGSRQPHIISTSNHQALVLRFWGFDSYKSIIVCRVASKPQNLKNR